MSIGQQPDPVKDLAERIRTRQCRLGVVGLGYVGLPLALAFAEEGVQVVGFEVDQTKADAVNSGTSYIGDVDSLALSAVIQAGTLRATTDFSELAGVDVISVCVPTPLSKSRDPDLTYVDTATTSIERCLRRGQLVVIESTTYPGMTQEYVRPRLERSGLTCGTDFLLAFSPERVDPANETYGIRNTPKVVGGVDEASTTLSRDFYAIAIDHVHAVSSASAAEMVKLLENTFLSVNIGLVNEVAMMCDKLGLDAREIIEAAGTKPFGFMQFWPGPGIGGHCIPLDPIYLSWKLRHLDYRARFVELAQDINTGMPAYLTDRIASALNARRLSVNGARILLMGVAYKPDVDDTRESPALDLFQRLRDRGADVSFVDPHVAAIEVAGESFTATPMSAEALAATDCVVVTTDHTTIDWAAVAQHAPLIVDARGAVPRAALQGELWPLSGPAQVGPRPERAAAPQAPRDPVETA